VILQSQGRLVDFFGENVLKVRLEILKHVVEQVYEIEGNSPNLKVSSMLPPYGTLINNNILLLPSGLGLIRGKNHVSKLSSQLLFHLASRNFGWSGKKMMDPFEMADKANTIFQQKMFSAKSWKTIGTKDVPVLTLIELFRWSFAVYVIKHHLSYDVSIPLQVTDGFRHAVQMASQKVAATPIDRALKTNDPKMEKLVQLHLNMLKDDMFKGAIVPYTPSMYCAKDPKKEDEKKRKREQKEAKQKKRRQKYKEKHGQNYASDSLDRFLASRDREERRANLTWSQEDIENLEADINKAFEEQEEAPKNYFYCELPSNHPFHQIENYGSDGGFRFDLFPELTNISSYPAPLQPIACPEFHQNLLGRLL
jgi:hypothetical protein